MNANPLTGPLQIGPTGRYLIDAQGVPCWVQGDTAWSLICGLKEEEVIDYLNDRAQKGFNALIVNLVEHMHKGPANRYGVQPFRVANDLSTPNEAYFRYADWVIEQAATYGLHVFLAPIYLGYKKPVNDADEGWFYEALASGPAKCYAYGRFLGQRYAHCPNLVWMMGGDRDPGAALAHVNAVVAGIRAYDRQHLLTTHCAPESSPLAEYGSGGWLDLNSTYTYAIVHRKLLADYRREPVKPFVLIESTYEGEHNASALQIRRQAYWALLCGATGQFLGNRPIWLFDPGWHEALNSTGSRDMVHLRTLVDARAWYTLVPDDTHRVVIEGLGEFTGLDYLAAALTADRRTLLAYLPTPRPFTINLEQFSGAQGRAWWYNPRTGQAALDGVYPLQSRRTWSPPGEGDWVFGLDDEALELPLPGT